MNLARDIEDRLPGELTGFLRLAGGTARGLGYSIYLVGGTVRDLLLRRASLDVDLTVEGDAIALARKLAELEPGRLTTHPRFITATLRRDGWAVDLVTARAETYARPGALPQVRPGTLKDDLFRRDFTVNALAVKLAPEGYGEVVDYYGGLADLEKRQLRVLHGQSFTDDATRIWRCLRYASRLGFEIEPETLRLLQRDIPCLDTVSSDRIRRELELVLREEEPEKALGLAGELGVLRILYPALRADGWLAERFRQARRFTAPSPPSTGLYLALLACRLGPEDMEGLIEGLHLPGPLARTIRDTEDLKSRLDTLDDPSLPPSGVCRFFRGSAPAAITAVLLATGSPAVREHGRAYLEKLRYVKPFLNGNDLLELGIPAGPRIKDILEKLRDARLDGLVSSREGELEMVKGIDL